MRTTHIHPDVRNGKEQALLALFTGIIKRYKDSPTSKEANQQFAKRLSQNKSNEEQPSSMEPPKPVEQSYSKPLPQPRRDTKPVEPKSQVPEQPKAVIDEQPPSYVEPAKPVELLQTEETPKESPKPEGPKQAETHVPPKPTGPPPEPQNTESDTAPPSYHRLRTRIIFYLITCLPESLLRNVTTDQQRFGIPIHGR